MKTRRRLLRALGVALAALVALIVLPRLVPPQPGVTEANCARIKPGMRQADVAAILGGPPWHVPLLHTDYGPAMWIGEEGVVAVVFDREGAVVSSHFNYSNRPPLLQRLRRRLAP